MEDEMVNDATVEVLCDTDGGTEVTDDVLESDEGFDLNADCDSLPRFDFSDDSVNNINERLEGEGYGLDRIDHINLGELEDDFWENSGKGGGVRNENTWAENMGNYPEILDRLNQGESLDEIWQDERLNPTCNTLFGRNPITLDTSDPNNVVVTDGRHRIAMAQMLGYTHLPTKR